MKLNYVLNVGSGVIFVMLLLLAPLSEGATIVSTKHNLSVTGPGPIKSLTETRVCVFCHTPHNASPDSPLWNKEVGSLNYSLYESSTMRATPFQPSGPSRLCLSCHDGTIALGTVLAPAGGISVAGQIEPGSPANIGFNLSLTGDHPFSFSYFDAISNPGINPVPPADLLFYSKGGLSASVECTTCHDSHKDRWLSSDKSGHLTGKFLLTDARYSALCLECHSLPNWAGSKHQASTALIDKTKFPVSPRQWPNWDTVAEWGCLICHTSHSSPSGQWLLNYATEAEVCDPCHGATPPVGDPHSTAVGLIQNMSFQTQRAANGSGKDITAQTRKISAHRMSTTISLSGSRSSNSLSGSQSSKLSSLWGSSLSQEVTCHDCHNSHTMTARSSSSGTEGGVTGATLGVSGIDRNGKFVETATYEYEICFKCHGDAAGQSALIPRVVDTANTRLQFDSSNPSFHPVLDKGINPNVPSIPSTSYPTLTVSSIITCTSCHNDDGETKGPHGSSFIPLLREPYATADNTTENYQSYALCYRCHKRDSILKDDSFKKNFFGKGGHSGHLAYGAPCSACHDPHGIKDDGMSGSHTHLINFDTRIVSPAPGNQFPIFQDLGAFSGSCTLVCHGRTHVNEAYPQGGGISSQRLSPLSPAQKSIRNIR